MSGPEDYQQLEMITRPRCEGVGACVCEVLVRTQPLQKRNGPSTATVELQPQPKPGPGREGA